MSAPDDDDPDRFDSEPTPLDVMDPVDSSGQQTQAYKSAEFLAGQQTGFKDGVEAAVGALRAELIRARCTEDEIKHIVARVRAGTASRS
jgi:hypothetical protein